MNRREDFKVRRNQAVYEYIDAQITRKSAKRFFVMLSLRHLAHTLYKAFNDRKK